MLPVTIENGAVKIGPRFAVTFQRTLRTPDDSSTYPLPPGLGRLPLFSVGAYADRIPSSWRSPHCFLVPMYQREALWLAFHGAVWKPNAVKIAVDGINVLTGYLAGTSRRSFFQDYLVCPNQPWIDGIRTAHGTVRQFVAAPLEPDDPAEQMPREDHCHRAIEITVFEPRSGRFPDGAPDAAGVPLPKAFRPAEREPPADSPIAGHIARHVTPDPYGTDTWDWGNLGRITVHIVNSSDFRKLTGVLPPPTPIDAGTYSRYGLPWFDQYAEHEADLSVAARIDGNARSGGNDRAAALQGIRVPEPAIRLDRTDVTAPQAEGTDEKDASRTA